MTALKEKLSSELVVALAAELGLGDERFVRAATDGLGELELLARVTHVARALGECLPFERGAEVLRTAEPQGWMALPCCEYVATFGLEMPEIALPLLARLTRGFSSEFAVRPFIERHPEIAFAHLHRWVEDPDEHLRRLVSEGTRPRLPWAPQLRALRADPRPAIDLLDRLVHDESEYVRRSVANHLNDIAKDHPELAIATAERWNEQGAARIVRHGLRSLVKQGDPRALALLGYDADAPVALHELTVTPQAVPVDGTVEIAFTLTAECAAPVMVDYRVHHAGARATRAPKVFKLKTTTLQPGKPLAVARRHAFRQVSVRRIHPGPHLVEIQVNGRVLGGAVVKVGDTP